MCDSESVHKWLNNMLKEITITPVRKRHALGRFWKLPVAPDERRVAACIITCVLNRRETGRVKNICHVTAGELYQVWSEERDTFSGSWNRERAKKTIRIQLAWIYKILFAVVVMHHINLICLAAREATQVLCRRQLRQHGRAGFLLTPIGLLTLWCRSRDWGGDRHSGAWVR